VKDFRDFVRCLDGLEWAPAGYLDPQLAELLAELGQQPGLIRDVVQSWNSPGLDLRQLSCHETKTHYKWFVHYDPSLRYKIWLHQYKSAGQRQAGHAEVPHNHRYSLASLIIRGGFAHHCYKQISDGIAELPYGPDSYVAGDVYAIEWHQIHRLSRILNHTVTLVVESPPARNFSEAFYGDSGEPRLFYDFAGMLSQFSSELAAT